MTVGSAALFDHLVLDSAPLLQNSFPSTLSKAFYTCPGVMSEMKDAVTRERMERLPFTLVVKQPSAEALALVTRWARATGDLAVLSRVDLEVLALMVTLEMEVNGANSKLLLDPKTRPECRVWNGAEEYFTSLGRKSKENAQVKSAKSNRHRKGGVEVEFFEETDAEKELARGLAAVKVTDEDEEAVQDDDSSDGEWITPENLDKYKQRHTGKGTIKEWTSSGVVSESPRMQVKNEPAVAEKRARIACISSDFAVQNVLLQMRCELYSPDGCRVGRLKNWLLRCHACYQCTFDLETGFCPGCGGPTMTRTSYMLDEGGQLHLFLKRDFEYRLRGTKYSIPKPVAGRKCDRDVLMLRADQKEYQRARTHYDRVQGKLERQLAMAGASESLEDKIWTMEAAKEAATNGSARRFDHYDGLALPTIGFGRRNPNAHSRKRS